jgi:hypothetical protein
MILRAKVHTVTGNTRHYLGAVVDGSPVPLVPLADPVWVELTVENGDVYLYRMDAEGDCITDTWHETLDEAMRQATFEFGIQPDQWTEVVEQN